MARSDPQMNFRIPTHLKEQLEFSAKQNNRSLTSELVTRLNESLNAVELNHSNDIHSKLDRIIKSLDTQ